MGFIGVLIVVNVIFCLVLVVNACPLFGRVSDVESTLGLDFELATLMRGLMMKVCDGSSVPGAYDLSDIFKAREESSLKCMSLKDCGFNKTLAVYLGIGGLTLSSVYYAGCKRFYVELILAINSAVSLRMDQCWSTAMLHPTMMKF